MLLSSMYASQTNKNVGQTILPRFMPSTMLWNVWTFFTFKFLSRWYQSSSTSSYFVDCIQLVVFALCTLIKYILYKLPSRSFIVVTSPSGPLIIHLFRFNSTFNPLDKNLFTKSNFFFCNLDIWGIFYANNFGFVIYQYLNNKDPNPIAFTMLSSPKCALRGLITPYVSNISGCIPCFAANV